MIENLIPSDINNRKNCISLTYGWLSEWLDSYGSQVSTDSMTATYTVYAGVFYLQIWTYDMSKIRIGQLNTSVPNYIDIEYDGWIDFTKENLNKVLRSFSLDPVQ